MMVYYILFIQEIKDIILNSMEVLDLKTCPFKSSLELMLCVVDILTLNKTYLI